MAAFHAAGAGADKHDLDGGADCDGGMVLKSQIRTPKSETNPKSEGSKSETAGRPFNSDFPAFGRTQSIFTAAR
jgi:hypothetical protein